MTILGDTWSPPVANCAFKDCPNNAELPVVEVAGKRFCRVHRLEMAEKIFRPRLLNIEETNVAIQLQRNLNFHNARFLAQLLRGEQTLDGLLDLALNAEEDQAEALFTAYNAFVPPTPTHSGE